MGTVDWEALRAAAVAASAHSFSPYSKFPVGVAGIADDGRLVSGANVESASYGLTLCAECSMISALHASGGGQLVAVYCVDGKGDPLMPCGRCRQLLYEHGVADLQIMTPQGVQTIEQILPQPFGRHDLAKRNTNRAD
ncbi:MAG TPA: cytidine deaminase [Mycobacterium sp.]|nr:cytidine deaminase [Mycobacterium sp.]